MAREEFSIVGGPSKFDLSVSLLYGESTNRVPIKFILEKKEWPTCVHSAVITGIQEKNRQADIWTIEMRLSEISHDGEIDHETTVRAVAKYSTRTRKGVLHKNDWNQLDHFRTLFIKMQDVGECEIDVTKVVKRWKFTWLISQWGEDEFMFCDGKFKAIISKSQAMEIVNTLNLMELPSPIFNSGTSWKKIV